MDTVRKTIRLYTDAVLKYKFWLSLHIFTVCIAVFCGSIVLPYIISRGVNALPGFVQNGGNFWSIFGSIIILFVVFQILAWSFWRTSGLAIVKLEIPVMRDLNQKVFNHLASMSYRFFTNTFGGSLVSQTNRFVGCFERLYDVLIFDFVGILVRFVFSSIVLFTFAPSVAIGLILWSVLFVASSLILSIKKLPLSKKAAANQSSTTARLADNLTNMSNIKYFAREKYETEQFNKVTQKLANSQYWDWGIGEIIFAWQGLLAIIFEIVVFWLSLYLVANHKIDLGQLVLVQLYTGNVIYNLWNVPRMVRRIESAFADSAEMTEILYTGPEIVDVAEPLLCEIKYGEIEFNNVSFCHKDALDNDPLFSNLNLVIKSGEKIGLAGPSGGGKTTLTKILLRLSDIDGGQIKIDNQNIAMLKQADLRQAITYVPQEPILFHRSLFDNIKYGKPSASTEEVKQAAKRAHADDFINKLPKGYETLVGERGVKLSGGQRQRVAIARAMLKNSPILLLDEATSALDSESEKLIQDALWKLMQGRTAIVVAHRLSTIQKLDRIVVLDNGSITEVGTHKMLLGKNGTYAKLWAHQSGGFIED